MAAGFAVISLLDTASRAGCKGLDCAQRARDLIRRTLKECAAALRGHSGDASGFPETFSERQFR